VAALIACLKAKADTIPLEIVKTGERFVEQLQGEAQTEVKGVSCQQDEIMHPNNEDYARNPVLFDQTWGDRGARAGLRTRSNGESSCLIHCGKNSADPDRSGSVSPHGDECYRSVNDLSGATLDG
jgi:hypothetical protein